MMLPTHVLVGMAVATPVALGVPEFAPASLLGVITGSVLPDLDLYAGHRRRLHYPSLYPIGAAIAFVAAAATGQPAVVGLGFLLLGAAIHCRLDRYGGGLSLRPWEAESDRAVYDHVRGRWRSPKQWIRYDGAPEDVVLAGVLGLPLWVVLGEPYGYVVLVALVVGVTYGLLRRRLADLAVRVFAVPPDPIQRYIPQRYQD